MLPDLKGAALPLNAWTEALNVRTRDGALLPIGTDLLWGTAVMPWAELAVATQVQAALPDLAGGRYAILVSGNRAYAFYAGMSVEITRLLNGGAHPYTEATWNTLEFNGVPMLNNGVDIPQWWPLADLNTPLENLPAWPANERAKCIRAFKNFLVAINIMRLGVNYPNTVHWSHPADPGSVPASWDIADASRDAGEMPLADTAGMLVDSVPLSDVNILYKTDAVYVMSFIGGTQIFSFRRVAIGFGAYNEGAVCAFNHNGEQHLVVTADDIKVFNGNSFRSIAQGKVRKWFNANMRTNAVGYSVTAIANPVLNEIVITSTFTGGTGVALIWNWVEDTFTTCNLGALYASSPLCLRLGTLRAFTDSTQWSDIGAVSWGAYAGNSLTWDNFYPAESSQNNVSLLSFQRDGAYIVMPEAAVGNARSFTVKHDSIHLATTSPSGQPEPADLCRKMLTGIKIQMGTTNTAQVENCFVQVYSVEEEGGGILDSFEVQMDLPSPPEGFPLLIAGRFFNLQINTVNGVGDMSAFSFRSYALDYQRMGRY